MNGPQIVLMMNFMQNENQSGKRFRNIKTRPLDKNKL